MQTSALLPASLPNLFHLGILPLHSAYQSKTLWDSQLRLRIFYNRAQYYHHIDLERGWHCRRQCLGTRCACCRPCRRAAWGNFESRECRSVWRCGGRGHLLAGGSWTGSVTSTLGLPSLRYGGGGEERKEWEGKNELHSMISTIENNKSQYRRCKQSMRKRFSANGPSNVASTETKLDQGAYTDLHTIIHNRYFHNERWKIAHSASHYFSIFPLF